MSDVIVRIDGAGRIVLPKPIREQFRLSAGSRLELAVGTDHVTLRPLGQTPALVKDGDWWVYDAEVEPGADLTEAVARHRSERLEDQR